MDVRFDGESRASSSTLSLLRPQTVEIREQENRERRTEYAEPMITVVHCRNYQSSHIDPSHGGDVGK